MSRGCTFAVDVPTTAANAARFGSEIPLATSYPVRTGRSAFNSPANKQKGPLFALFEGRRVVRRVSAFCQTGRRVARPILLRRQSPTSYPRLGG